MASHSPTKTAAELEGDYVDGWRDVSRLMDDGASWSGNERNCAYVNVGGRRFVDVSAVTGFDHVQDGRAVAQTDWDGDGDLDLWLKSRNGQQLRLLENRQEGGGSFVALRLRGTTSNSGAIGARVEVEAGEATYLQEVRAGEGYLAQSSAELVFGLPAGAELEAVTVHWPGGEAERFEGAQLGRHHRLVQGEGRAALLDVREPSLPAPTPFAALPASKRVVLRTPLPLPTATQRRFFDASRPGARLVNLWATWCAPCLQELGDLARRSEDLAAAGVEVVPLCLDGEEDPGEASRLFAQSAAAHLADAAAFTSRNTTDEDRALFEVLFEHLIAARGAMPVPTSFLVDNLGRVVVVYLGPVDVDGVLRDAATFAGDPQAPVVRSGYPGRWFFGVPRDWAGLSRAFEARGLSLAAKFYAALDRRTPR